MSGNLPRGTPGKALIGFAVLTAMVAAFTVRDHFARPQLEEIYSPTGLGDADIFEGLDEVDRGQEMLRVGGEAFYRLEYNPDLRPDDRMMKVGRDDKDRCFVYELEPRPGSGEDGEEADVPRYVKVGEGEGSKSYYLLVGKEVPPQFLRRTGDEQPGAGAGAGSGSGSGAESGGQGAGGRGG